MPESLLARTLKELRGRIARVRSPGLNEQNTKATLIEPVLRALGWDTEDVEEVVREYRIKSRDKPVDYGLLVLRTPRLFVEAKALGENLDDRRWTNQIMGYAGVAGVQWIVLTDGNEYRIYNTHAPVSVEEKLFRTVRVSDDGPLLHETLELLAKDRLEENRIEQLWRANFVDRQVKGPPSVTPTGSSARAPRSAPPPTRTCAGRSPTSCPIPRAARAPPNSPPRAFRDGSSNRRSESMNEATDRDLPRILARVLATETTVQDLEEALGTSAVPTWTLRFPPDRD